MSGADPAFPAWMQDSTGMYFKSFGFTKRELFAALAMQGSVCRSGDWTLTELAKMSIRIAAALVGELDKTGSEPRS